MQNVVVSVGMGPGQLDFIRYLKKEGFCVAAFGRGENAQEAVEIADYCAEIDTKDSDGAIAWLDSLDVCVIAVGSYAGGGAVQTVQKLSTYYRTPTMLPKELIVGNDKKTQQAFYEKYNLSSIRTWDAKEVNIEEIQKSAVDEYILKPKKGRGSEGICYLSKEKLVSLLEKGENAISDCIIQTVCCGREYRCALMVQKGKIKMLAPILRKSYEDTVFLGVLKYSEKDNEQLYSFFEEFIDKSGIENSIIKADVIVSKKRVDVIEMDIGVGGGGYYKTFLSRVFDKNLMEDYVRLITGCPISDYKAQNKKLRMDYVFNHSKEKVSYDLQTCKDKFCAAIGPCEILVNRLRPERKGGYASNADFVFAVIFEENASNEDEFWVDKFANEQLFYQGEMVE